MKKFLVLACVASFAMIVGCDDDTDNNNSGSTPNVGDACNIEKDSDYCNGSSAIYCDEGTSKYVAYDCSQDAEEGYSPVCVTLPDYFGPGVESVTRADKKQDACTESDVESAVGFCEENESYTWVCLETSGGYMYVFDSTETCDDGCDSDGISCK